MVPGRPAGAGRCPGHIDADHSCTRCRECVSRGTPDARRGAGHQRHLTGQGSRRTGTSELGLLELPVLDVEQIGLAERHVAAQRFGGTDHVDRVEVDVRGDVAVDRPAPSGPEPEMRVEHNTRCGIQHGERRVGVVPGTVALEIGAIVLDEGIDIAAHHRELLGADDVIRGRRPTACHRRHIVASAERVGALVAHGAQQHRRAGRNRNCRSQPRYRLVLAFPWRRAAGTAPQFFRQAVVTGLAE